KPRPAPFKGSVFPPRGVMRMTKLLRHAHSFLEAITSTALAVIMVLIVVDAAMRYLWNYPLGFVYEITTLYLIVALFFLALSGSYSGGHHIRIHVIFEMLGATAKRWAFLISEGLAVIFFILVTVEAGKTLRASISHNEVISGIITWY